MKARQQLLNDMQACANSAAIKIDLREEPIFLGSGNYAELYSVLLQDTQQPVAIKLIDTKDMNESECEHESGYMASLTGCGGATHGIMPFIGSGYNASRSLYAIFMPCMEKGPLVNWLEKKKEMNILRQVQITYGIACGLSFLHQRDVLHRDIKPENILLDVDFNPFIADFGLVKRAKDGPVKRKATDDPAGTVDYMAPEILIKYLGQDFCYSTASDVYAFALVIWQTFFRKKRIFEFYTNETEKRFADAVVNEEYRPKMRNKKKCPEPISSLITWGWASKPEQRPTSMQMKDHLLKNYGEMLSKI